MLTVYRRYTACQHFCSGTILLFTHGRAFTVFGNILIIGLRGSMRIHICILGVKRQANLPASWFAVLKLWFEFLCKPKAYFLSKQMNSSSFYELPGEFHLVVFSHSSSSSCFSRHSDSCKITPHPPAASNTIMTPSWGDASIVRWEAQPFWDAVGGPPRAGRLSVSIAERGHK